LTLRKLLAARGRLKTPEDRTERIASLKRQLLFHHERRKMAETDPNVSAEDRAEQLEYYDRLALRLLDQLIELEGH
jgi:hypothetical protein